MAARKMVIAGGSGFLGRTLAQWFSDRGMEVVVLSRRPVHIPGARTVLWDGKTFGAWCGEVEGAEVVVNLAGRSVNCRYNEANRKEILDSRVLTTRILGEAIQGCATPPSLWINSSTATIYRHTFGEPHDENGETGAAIEAKDAFSIEVARAWEQAFDEAACPETRKVVLRTAVVIDREPGTAYSILRRLARLGLGGPVGDGRQYFSWIHTADFCRALEWIVEHQECRGIYNVSAPHPLCNREMMAELRRAVGMPIGLPATHWMLEIGTFLLRTEAELVIKSRRVVSGRLAKEGFVFEYPRFADAVRALEGRRL